MGLLDKAKAAAETAAAKAKEGVEDVQTKRELSQTYADLGRLTFSLVESGELTNPEFAALADKIRALEAKAAAEPVATGAPAPPSDQPPAMPT
jgi:CRISPR/Cas system type I-B associated protein Csh2 (Cas7 group RAMP superfamily)